MLNLNLLVLRCADLEASKRFYELVGMRFSRHAHGAGPEHYAHEDARGVFELYPAKPGEQDRIGLGFTINEFTAARDRFAEASFAPGPVVQNEWGTSFLVRDPDGRRVEIKQSS